MEKMVMKDLMFWNNKKVLITGHSGFKGAWLCILLSRLGAKITGVSLPPITNPSLYKVANIQEICNSNFIDIQNTEAINEIVKKANPEIIFHLAAQPLVRLSYKEPINTFSTNVIGTANILNAMRQLDNLRVAVMVTTDKVYRNNEWNWPYREDDTLGGHDPYSASKAASELVIDSFRSSFLSERNIAIASARAGNVIGGGDWSEDRIIPDAIKAWQSGGTLFIRNPYAIRPWQHVLDPLSGYMVLAEKLWNNPEESGAYNFGPEPNDVATVKTIVEKAFNHYQKGKIEYSQNYEKLHEAGILMLESSKSRKILNLKHKWNLNIAVEKTMDWYKEQEQNKNAFELCVLDIEKYNEE